MISFEKPKNCTIKRFSPTQGSDKNISLRYAHLNATHGKNTLLILEGKSEFIEKYFQFAQEWAETGFQVFVFDWYQQGHSSRREDDPHKYHFEDTDFYTSHLQEFVQNIVLPEKKGTFITYAHSMGAHFLLKALLEKKISPDGQIFSSPLFNLAYGYIPRWIVLFLLRIKEKQGQLYDYALTQNKWRALPFPIQRLTTHRKTYKKTIRFLKKNPTLQSGGATFGWVKAMRTSCADLKEKAYPLKTPTLLLMPGNEKIIDAKAFDFFAKKLQIPEEDQLLLKGAKHELQMEKRKTKIKIWKKIDQWLLRHYTIGSKDSDE